MGKRTRHGTCKENDKKNKVFAGVDVEPLRAKYADLTFLAAGINLSNPKVVAGLICDKFEIRLKGVMFEKPINVYAILCTLKVENEKYKFN